MKSAAFLMIFLLPSAVLAQPAGEVVFELPVQWTVPIDDVTTRQQRVGGSAAFDYLFASEHGRAFYEMTLETFGTPDTMRTWLHNAGLTGTFGDETRSIEIGGSAFWRANEGTWADAGFRGVNVIASAQAKPASLLTISGSYALYMRTFPDQPALDQVEQFGSWRALLNLPSRTSLVGVLSIGRKAYDGQELVAVPTGTAVASSRQGSGTGRGWRQIGFVPIQLERVGEPGARSDWSWAARVAQSLDDRTGFWIEREQRRTSGDLPPALVWTPPLFYEDGVYDDPYVVDADTWRAGVKHIFASGIEIGATGSVSDRAYAGLTRADRLTRARFETTWPFVSGRSGSIDGVASYAFFQNASSEPDESYRAHQVTVGVRFGF